MQWFILDDATAIQTYEEYAAAEAGRRLLIDDTGVFRSDDTAVFLDEITTDNDTRGPSNFIKEQNRIIGESSDCLAEQLPDGGHVMKNCSNAFYKIRKNDPSFGGSNLLENTRIKAIVSDIRAVLNAYKISGIDDCDERKKCLNTIYAIVTHHCGDHSSCRHLDVCNCKYADIKSKNSSLMDFQVQC